MQRQQRENKIFKNSLNINDVNLINIHEVYYLFLINYNKIMQRKSFFVLKQTLRMKNENVIIKNFNSHHFH